MKTIELNTQLEAKLKEAKALAKEIQTALDAPNSMTLIYLNLALEDTDMRGRYLMKQGK